MSIGSSLTALDDAMPWVSQQLPTISGGSVASKIFEPGIYRKLGASVTMPPGGKRFQALEKGVLDATELSLPTVDQQLGFDEVTKHYYLPGCHHPSTNQFRYVNLPISNKLKPQTQARIETTCTAAVIMALAEASTKDPVFKKVDESMAASCVAFPAIITGLPGKMYGAG
ncbi:MAG: hypothetical protein AB7P21_07890 [Lautropia sp.]